MAKKSWLPILLLVGIFSLFQTKLEAKIYDCITFFNEVKTLEIRLHELYDQVDHFVIVEGNVGFSGLPKEHLFPQYAHLFEKYKDKIIYIPLHEATRWVSLTDPNGHKYKALRGVEFANAWDRSNFQKNSVYLGLVGCEPEDIILFSDLDEIPSGESVALLKETLQSNEIVVFQQKLYRGYYNRRGKPERDPDWFGSLAMHYRVLQQFGPQAPNHLRTSVSFGGARSFPSQGLNVRVVKAGWHFTSIGSFEQYIAKMDNWEHFENPCPRTPEGRRAEIASLHIREEIDESFPRYIRENVEALFREGYLDHSDAW